MGRQEAANLDEPGLLLYRSNLLGADLRITNFGGGNTSAKVEMKDPLTGERRHRAVGQGLRRRHRLDEARRLRHALHGQARIAEGPLQEPRPGRRDGARAEPLHLRSQSARALDRHLPAWLCALCPCRSCPFRRGDRHCRLEGLRAADQGDLRRRDGLPALAAPRHRPRHQAWRDGQGAIPNMSAWCWAATASSPGAKTAKDCYDTTLRIINKAAVWLERNGKKPAFKGAEGRSLPEAERRRPWRSACCPRFAAASRSTR